MKKRYITYFLLTLGLAVSSQSVIGYTNKALKSNIQTASVSETTAYSLPEEDTTIKNEVQLLAQQQTILEKKLQKKVDLKQDASPLIASNDLSSNQAVKSATLLSRGGTNLPKPQAKAPVKTVEKKRACKADHCK